jgi:two-component system, NtrC family, sensor kinase
MRRGAKRAKATGEARLPRASKSLKNEASRGRQLQKRLAEALERETEALKRETATREILRVISESKTDVQPVFDTIAERAMRLCGALHAAVVRFDGELIHLVALANMSAEGADALRRAYPRPPSRRTAAARAILTRAIVHIPDVEDDPEYEMTREARTVGYRSVLSVPMLRDAQAIGAINVLGGETRSFSERQVQLLQTFADHAVIAIENVRLFKELRARNSELTEALDQQTATSEILRVISGSPTDLQPVFDTIVDCAVKLCRAEVSNVTRFDGEWVHLAAVHVDPPGADRLRRLYPARPSGASASLRAIRDQRVVHIPDLLEDPEYEVQETSRVAGFRAVLSVPMLQEGRAIGSLTVGRTAPGRFSDKQIALLRTFANQAVIAIENARLFTELQTRTSELTRSVDELEALGEVSRALSSTLDLETVLATIVSRAIQLSGTDGGTIWEYDETAEEFRLRAARNLEDEIVDVLLATPLRRGEGTVGRLADTRAPIQVADISGDTAFRGRLDVMVRAGYRSILSVPLLREDHLIGALTVNAKTPREFRPEVVGLLATFATQSALAIQNARLFREIEEKSRELEATSQHKSEFLANMSHELRTPLNAIIGFSEVLVERMFGEVNEKQAEYLQDILASGRHLLSLINDILDLSKVEAGRLELELASFNLPIAVENALTLIRERATRHGITLAPAVDERVGDIVADERKVKQILLNLLSNAVKFSPAGGRVAVTATTSDGVIEISVSDTGIGIAPEDQAVIFEEFRQAGTSDAQRPEGTGLGLTLAKKFVELHGGQIWVRSQVGQGSTFTFTLPVRPESKSSRK